MSGERDLQCLHALGKVPVGQPSSFLLVVGTGNGCYWLNVSGRRGVESFQCRQTPNQVNTLEEGTGKLSSLLRVLRGKLWVWLRYRALASHVPGTGYDP